MANHPHPMLHLVAAGIAAMSWIATPAAATELTSPAGESPATARSAPVAVSHHAFHARRLAATRYADRHGGGRIGQIRGSELSCSGAWCGRQFVLMIGIGF
jgi:hypothetical protein